MLADFGKLLRAIASGTDPARVPPPSEVLATMEVGNAPPDWLYPRGTFLYSGGATEGAGAGARGHVALYNHTGSKTLAVVKEARWRSSEGLAWLRITNAAGVAAFDDDGFEYCRDGRQINSAVSPFPPFGPACRVLTDTVGLTGQGMAQLIFDSYDGTYRAGRFTHPVVLFPGWALLIAGGADNTALVGMFHWEERRIDPEEVRGTLINV